MSAGTRSEALDFSCSSGRVVRPLAAALPEIVWRGCDPNADAIEWARAHVPGVDFFVSDTKPPLPLGMVNSHWSSPCRSGRITARAGVALA